MIVVGMECGHEGNERLSEYSPYSFGKFFLGPVRGTGKATMDWIVQEVKPMIDREYRTYSFREATGIAGSSMGGLMSLYAAAAYNRFFSKAACLSSTITPCFDHMAREVLAHRLDADTRVYLSWGSRESWGGWDKEHTDPTSESFQWNHAIAHHVWAQGGAGTAICQEGGGHCEADWEKLVPDFMDFLWMR